MTTRPTKLTRRPTGLPTFTDRALDLLDAYAAWPTDTPSIDAIDQQLARCAAVEAVTFDPPPPFDVDRFLADPAAETHRVATTPTLNEFQANQREARRLAHIDLARTVNEHSDTIWATIDAWAEWAPKLLELDLTLPDRLSAAETRELTPTSRKALDEAITARAVQSAVLNVSDIVVPRNQSRDVGAEQIVRCLTFTEQTWNAYRDGLGLRDVPNNGETPMLWALRAGATPSIARTTAAFKERTAELSQWYERRLDRTGMRRAGQWR